MTLIDHDLDRSLSRSFQGSPVRGGLPGIQWTLEEMTAGDKVAARLIMRRAHGGTFLRVPPTGKQLRCSGAGDEILPLVRRAIRRRTRPVRYACAVETDRRGANSLGACPSIQL